MIRSPTILLRPLPLLLSVGAYLLAGVSHAAPAATSVEVQVEDGVLMLHAKEAPLTQVIRAIGEEAGFETIVIEEPESVVNRSFTGVFLEKGLRILLRGVSNVRFYESSEDGLNPGHLRQVWLYGQGRSVPVDSESPDIKLVNSDRETRIEVIWKLAQSENVEAVDSLGRVLAQDDDPLVRSQAAKALGRIDMASAIVQLHSALSDPHRSVRIEAVRALSRIGGHRAVQLLGEILLYESDQRARLVAASALGRSDEPAARSFLRAAETDTDPVVRNAIRRVMETLY